MVTMSLTALWTLGDQLLRIGKVMDVLITGCFTAFYQCLSRMRWKSHVRFLGDLGLATVPGYPTCDKKSLLILLDINPTYCITSSFLLRRALSVMILCEARRTMKPLAVCLESKSWEELNSGSINPDGSWNDGMRNISELLINTVSTNRLKMLVSLNQNGKRYG